MCLTDHGSLVRLSIFEVEIRFQRVTALRMLEALIITLREGVEAALVIGIILAYLRKIGRQELNRSVYAGLMLAVGASILGAVALSRVDINEELVEGIAMLLAAVFVGSMVIWMWRTARRLKGEIEQRVSEIASPGGSRVSFGLIAFTFLMIFREGIETVLFLGAVNLTTDALLSFFGGILGLGLAVVFGVSFFKGAIRIDLGRFFKVTGVVLLVFAAQLLIGGIHELAEAGVIPMGRSGMGIVGPIVKNDVLFILAIVALPLIILLVPGQRERERLTAANMLEGAEKRKQLAQIKRAKRWRLVTAGVGVIIFTALTVNYAYSRRPRTVDPPKMVQAEDGQIKITVATVNDGNLHRFGFKVGDTIIRFLAIKTDEKIRTAFDACLICGAYGYVQEGRGVVCLNCAADIHTPTIGQSGGCNPIPLASHIEGEHLMISLSELVKGGDAFAASGTIEVVDPVCGMKLHVADAREWVTHQGTTYYFCKMPHCAAEFKKGPGKYSSKQ
jgi:FTR1 family protein